jgi:hypothetical protein
MWVQGIGGRITTGKNQSTWKQTCPSPTLSTTNLTWTGLGLNTNLSNNRLATNDLCQGFNSQTMIEWNNHYRSFRANAKSPTMTRDSESTAIFLDTDPVKQPYILWVGLTSGESLQLLCLIGCTYIIISLLTLKLLREHWLKIVIEEIGVGKLIPLCLTINVPDTKIKVVGKLMLRVHCAICPEFLFLSKWWARECTFACHGKFRRFSKQWIWHQNFWCTHVSIPPGEDTFFTQLLLRSTLILSSHLYLHLHDITSQRPINSITIKWFFQGFLQVPPPRKVMIQYHKLGYDCFLLYTFQLITH